MFPYQTSPLYVYKLYVDKLIMFLLYCIKYIILFSLGMFFVPMCLLLLNVNTLYQNNS